MNEVHIEAPIFVLGRQHSGNTMLSAMLGRHEKIYAHIGESQFVERIASLKTLSPEDLVREMTRLIAVSDQPALAFSEVETVVSRMWESRLQGHVSNVNVVELYLRSMTELAIEAGKNRWSQKATSYIFYVPDLVRYFPNSKSIFIARNPFDVGASLKRRGSINRIFRMIWGWNVGAKLSRRYERTLPKNFIAVRYEDMVTRPTDVLRLVCEFIGITYDKKMLNIPHVNKSESQYNLHSAERGIQKGRVGYFRDVLTDLECHIIGSFVDRESLEHFYPKYVSTVKLKTIKGRVMGLPWIVTSFYSVLVDRMRLFRCQPAVALDNLLKRVKHKE